MPNQRAPEPLTIQFFARGLYTNRQPLYSALTPLGVNVVQFHDALIDGVNIEVTDQYTLRRRPPFIKYCSQQLASGEIVKQFYGIRNLAGNVTVYADTNQRLLTVTPSALTSVLSKGTANQGFVQQVGDMTYYANGTDLKKIDRLGNVTGWGIAAPTVAPLLGTGRFWRPLNLYPAYFALEDPNGNVEFLTAGAGSYSGAVQPAWPVPLITQTQDGGLTWINYGPVGTWQTGTAYVGPVVILDTNGNLQEMTAGTSGTSGTSLPSWSTTLNASTTDNTATWFNKGPGTVLASSGYSWVYAYRTIYGDLSTASEPSGNTGPIFGAQRVNLTAFSISGGVITFTGANNFVAGDVFQVQGLSNGTYLNGAFFTVLSSSLSTSAFEADLTTDQINAAANAGQNTGSTISDSGYTLNVITTVTGEGTTDPQCNATATISNVQVLDNIVTCLASNNFAPGIWLTITGLSGIPIAESLNNQQIQVLTADSTQFTFEFNFPDYGPSPDSGTATFDAIEVYRTLDGGGQYLFSGALVNPPSTPYDSGATIAGAGSGSGWTNPSNIAATGSSYATIAVTEGSGAVNFSKVQSANGVAQYASGGSASATDNCGTGTDTNNNGVPWTNPNNVASAGQSTTCLIAPSATSDELAITNFGFAIPTGSTINGIVATVNTSGSQNLLQDAGIFLRISGADVGTDHSAGGWGGTYGSSSDLWGASWTPSQINDSTFGIGVSATSLAGSANRTAQINAFPTIAVYYTAPNGASTSCTATFGNSITSGNAIIVCAQGRDGAPSISDNQSNSYTTLKTSGNMVVAACYAPAAAATTVTATFSGTNGGLLLIQEVFGIIGSSQVDQSANSSASTATGSVTTTNANDAICTFLLADGTPSFTVPSGYTSLGNVSIQESDSTYGIADAFKQVSSTGTSNPAWSISGTALDGITVAFKVAILGTSGPLTANSFGLNVPFGVIDGIKVVFHAKTSSVAAPCSVTAQLLRNGQPVGLPKTTGSLTASDAAYTFGSNTDTWGLAWSYFNFNNSSFGVVFTVTVGSGTSGSYTFSLNDAAAEIFGTNQTWTYQDATPDANLVEELIAPLAHINDPAPGTTGSTVSTGGTILAYWNGRMWMAVGNKVYFSGGPDILNGVPEECWPPDYFFTFPGNVTGLKVLQGGILVAVGDSWWSIQGGPQTVAFYPDQVFSHFGTPTANCLAKDGDVIIAYTGASQCFSISGATVAVGVSQSGSAISGPSKNEIGFRVGNILRKGQNTPTCVAAPWTPSNTSITVHRDGYDSGIWLSNGSGSLLRYGINVENWSTIYQPLLSGSPQAGVIASVETAPDVWTLLLASNAAHDYIYCRDFDATTFQDNGNPYDAAAIVGNITASQPGQPMVPVYFITAYCANVGSVPTVSFMPNEIAVQGTAAFTVLPTAQNEPAFLAASQSIMGKRWPVFANQNATPLRVKHVQIKLDFGTDTVANELYVLGLKFDMEQLS